MLSENPNRIHFANSHSSKISRVDSTPGMQARGPIFCMVTLGTHRYYQNILEPDPSTFQIWCHPTAARARVG